ncbi:MAG: hypothetical protein U0L49_06965 [Eubacterium sp.]|nr:hypothetical protein [Eubacterium sp.]
MKDEIIRKRSREEQNRKEINGTKPIRRDKRLRNYFALVMIIPAVLSIMACEFVIWAADHYFPDLFHIDPLLGLGMLVPMGVLMEIFTFFLSGHLFEKEEKINNAIRTVADGAGGGKKLYGSLLKDGAYYDSPHYPAQIISAVGAGDAFSAAVIAAAKLDFAEADQIRFATAAAALKYSIPGDVNLVSKEEVVRFMQKAGSGWIDR